MYYFDLVQAEVSEAVDKFNNKEHLDPAISKNIDQIQVINQILAIIEEDLVTIRDQRRKAHGPQAPLISMRKDMDLSSSQQLAPRRSIFANKMSSAVIKNTLAFQRPSKESRGLSPRSPRGSPRGSPRNFTNQTYSFTPARKKKIQTQGKNRVIAKKLNF